MTRKTKESKPNYNIEQKESPQLRESPASLQLGNPNAMREREREREIDRGREI